MYAAGELDDSSIFGQAQTLAENFGIASLPSSSYSIPDIIDSRSLKKEIVTKEWDNFKYNHFFTILSWEWDIHYS